jgi:two-component system cell cycle sensor histidine kinase/response regulator CckA
VLDLARKDYLTHLATHLLLAGAYVVAGKIGLTLALLNPSATAVWPPTGIALAAVLILGPRRAWPGIFVGAFLVNQLTAGSWLTSVMIAIGNTSEALLGSYLVNRFAGGRTGFGRSRNLLWFAALAGFLSTAVSATIGVTSLYLAGYAPSEASPSIWTTWWLGDAAGAILVAPAVLLWHSDPRPRWSPQQQMEILLLGCTTVLVAWAVFVGAALPFPFLCIPVCIWAGLRFGQREAAVTACVLSVIAVWGTLRGHGTPASASLNAELLRLQAFMATAAMVGLVVGAAVEESKSAAREARRLNDELERRVQGRTAELQRAYDQLVTGDARLREAQELAHVGSWEWNVADNSAWWSEELFRIYGADPESVKPSRDSFFALLPGDDREKMAGILQKSLADRQPFQIEHRIVRLDGGVRVMYSLGRVVVDDEGEVVRMVGASQDITDRKAAEEVVRHSERRLQTILDAQPACVKLVSIDGILLDMNRAGLEMVGADDLSQLEGRPIVDLVHEDDRGKYLETHRAASNGTPGRMEFRLTGLDGRERFVDSRAVPFDTPDSGSGTQRSVLSVTSDITGQKLLEAQLLQAQKMEAIGQLAGGVAHDFNNMLAIILGYSDMLTEQIGPDKPIGRDLREIKAAAERAAALTKQLLAFSRKQVFSLVAVDVNDVVRTVEPMLQRLLGERITITTALAGDLVPVMADTAQLEHLLINLSLNARDAMPEGGVLTFATANVTLDAMFTREHPGASIGPHVMLSVADTGIGMSSEVQARIFEPFFTTKESGRGTGLGLAAAYGTVKQLGGYIEVESQLRRGTRFSLYLPKTTHTVHSPLTAASVSAHVGNETILLVEDESAVRAFVQIALQRFGYRVIEADTAEAALRLMKEYAAPIHLLLTDVVLPGMDGIQLAAHVSRERPDARVLFMSGYAKGLESVAGKLDPGIHFLEKPFTVQALLAKTRQLLGIYPGQSA